MGGEVSTDFKCSNRIEISRLVKVLLNFDWLRESPQGVGGGWMGWGVVRGYPPHTWTCMRMHACTHTRVWHHNEFPGIPQKSNGSSHLHEIIMFTTCTCACMHACTCVCTCVGHPPTTPHPHPPTPTAAGSPKHQNSISLELIEIIQFCSKILYLWTFLNSYRL